MAFLMPRDMYILKALRHGPLTFVKLHAQLLTISKKKFGDIFVPQVDVDTPATPSMASSIKQDNYLFTKKALKNRLTLLLKDGFIKSRTYGYRDGKGRCALYVVGKMGIPELYRHGFEHTDIRCTLPHKFAIAHETLVTDIVKGVKRESSRVGFKVKIVDENHLRKTVKKKRLPIPDLMVSMVFHLDSGKVLERIICLEIDNDTMPVADIYKKCTKLERPTIFIIATHERMDRLRSYFETMKTDPLFENIADKVSLLLMSDLLAQGLVGCEIVDVNGGKRLEGILPLHFKTKRQFQG